MSEPKKPEEGGILLPNNVRTPGKVSLRARNKRLKEDLKQLSDYHMAVGVTVQEAHKIACEQYDALHLVITPAGRKARKGFEAIATLLGPIAAPVKIEIKDHKKGGDDARSASEEDGKEVPPGGEGDKADSSDGGDGKAS